MNYQTPISTNPIKLDNQEEDGNGNRAASVAEIRRKFDTTPEKTTTKTTTNGLLIEGKPISENRFKKQDADNNRQIGSRATKKTTTKSTTIDRPILNGDVNVLNGKAEENGVEVENGGRALGGAQDAVVELGKNHTSNFASYIWSNDYKKEGEATTKEEDGSGTVDEVSCFFFN